MDIETNVEDEFPDPVKAEQPITFIQVYDNIDDEIKMFHWQMSYSKELADDVESLKFDTEQEMLDAWLNYYFDKKPSIVTGWNFISFDLRYITNRLRNLGYKDGILSPFNKTFIKNYDTVTGEKIKVEYPIGPTWIDYADIFYQHAYIKTPDKKLDTMAKTVLETEEDGKLDWKRYFKSFRDMAHFKYTPPDHMTEEMENEQIYKVHVLRAHCKDPEELERIDRELIQLSHDILFDYSELDVRLLKEVDAKIQLASLAYGYAWGMGINPADILGTVKPWTALLYGSLQEFDYHIPASIPEHDFYKPIGGYWAATAGLWEWIMSQDFTSLYPLNAVSLNMSPETIIHKDKVPKDLDELLKPLQRYWGILPKEKKDDPDEEGWIDRDDSQEIYIAMSQETKEKIRDLAEKYNYSVSTNGVCFTNEFEGILPKLIMRIFSKRKEYKALMKKAKNRVNEIKALIKENGSTPELQAELIKEQINVTKYDILQMVEKIKINSLYGALGNKHFPIGISDIAAAITAYGRFSLMMLSRTGNEVHQKVTGKDIVVTNWATDACYFVCSEIVKKKYGDNIPSDKEVAIFLDGFNKKILNPAIEKNIQRNLDLLNGFTNVMGCDREVIASKGLVTGISRYALRVIDDEGVLLDEPKMKVIGMPNITMTIPEIVRKELDAIINTIFDKDNREFTKHISRFKKEFKKLRPSQIAIKAGMNDITSKKYYISVASRVHNKVIDRLGIGDEFDYIQDGDKVMLAFLKKNPVTEAETIGFLEEAFLRKSGLDKYIDHNKHYEKLFYDNVEKFADIIGWNMKSSGLLMKNYF